MCLKRPNPFLGVCERYSGIAMVRMPVRAGSFYEGQKDLLLERLKNCFLGLLGPGKLPEGEPGTMRSLKAVISPHAGYMYSGMPAAHSYLKIFEDGIPEHIVVLGPNHTGLGARLAVCNDDWQTPLGTIGFDGVLGSAIVEEDQFASNDCIAHSNEHSIEVQLPFLQFLGKDSDFQIVPFVISSSKYSICEKVGRTIADAVKKSKRDVFVIASTDFTHYGKYYYDYAPVGSGPVDKIIKWVYETDSHTMISVDTQVVGNKFLMIFDNSKKCSDPEILKVLKESGWL